MRILNILIPSVLVMIGVGCQCGESRTTSRTSTVTQSVAQTTVTQPVAQTSTPEPAAAPEPPPALVPAGTKPISVQQVVTDKATYTIETLPNPTPRLTPTSREGDKAEHVYSSNIIAVYVHTNSGVTVNSTNIPAAPTPQNQPQP